MLKKMSSKQVKSIQSNESICNSTKSSNKNSLSKSNKDSMNIFRTKNSFEQGNEFIKCRKWKYINDESWNEIENKVELIGRKMNQEKLSKIIQDIKLTDLNQIFNENCIQGEYPFTIGPLNSLNYLIENTYYFNPTEKEIMLSDRMNLVPYIHKFRIIKGDGNCFIRGIIFYFLEYIILQKNVMLMKELLVLFNEKISLENNKIKNKDYICGFIKKVDIERVTQILYIIVKYLESEIDYDLTPYTILLKVFLFCQEFDYGIIFFTRYLIYEFISENENKFISSNNINEKLGNLLPDKYIVKGSEKNEYLFDNFYKELLTMDEFIEKIVVYVSPYVFNFELTIIFYNYQNLDNSVQELTYKCGKHTEYEINLLFRDNHYDIIYKKFFYEKYQVEMNILLDTDEKLCILNDIQRNIKRHLSIEYDKNKVFESKGLIKKSMNLKGSEESVFKPLKNSQMSDSRKDNRRGSAKTLNKEKFLYNIQIQKNSENNENIENLPKCLKCKNPYNHRENVFYLCKNCLEMELKDKILQAYLSYLQYGFTSNCAQNLKQFISRIKCSISMQNNIYLNTAIENSGFTFKNLFLDIKEKMCLFCGKNIDNNKYYIELPCKCKICNKKCFEKYMDHVDEMNRTVLIDSKDDEEMIIIPMTECSCGFKYKLKDFIYMINELDKKKEAKHYKKIYEKQIKNNWKWLCIICRESFTKRKSYYRLILSDDKIDKKLLENIELKHLICKVCSLDYNIGNPEKEINKIFCKFCNSEHSIDYVKKVDKENKTISECTII
jgi:hypothetical protein